MPLVYWDSNQPQASIHKSTTRTLPAALSVCHGGAPATHAPGAHSGRRAPRNWCVGAPWPRAPSPPVTQPCVHLRELAHKPQTLGRWTDLSFSLCSCPVCGGLPFHSDDSAHFWFTQWYRFESWKPQTEMTVQNKKWVRVITIEVFFLGRKCWLWVLSECAMRNFQRAPLTIRNSRRMFQPSKGQLFRVCVGFYQNLVWIGKIDWGEEEEWKGWEGKNTSQTKARTKKTFLYQYRLYSDIRHLWKLASEWSVCLYLVSLRIPSLGCLKFQEWFLSTPSCEYS